MKGGVSVRHPGKPKKCMAGTAKAFLGALGFRVWCLGILTGKKSAYTCRSVSTSGIRTERQATTNQTNMPRYLKLGLEVTREKYI